MSRFLTHWMPRLLKTILMSSVLISSVQTPLLHPSRPTKLWGWGLRKKFSKFVWTFQLKTVKNLLVRKVFGNARNDNDCTACVVHYFDCWICFAVWCAIYAGNRPSRSSFTLITKTQCLRCRLFFNYHVRSLCFWLLNIVLIAVHLRRLLILHRSYVLIIEHVLCWRICADDVNWKAKRKFPLNWRNNKFTISSTPSNNFESILGFSQTFLDNLKCKRIFSFQTEQTFRFNSLTCFTAFLGKMTQVLI